MSEKLFVLKQVEGPGGIIEFQRINIIIPDGVVPSDQLLRAYQRSKIMLRDIGSRSNGPTVTNLPDVTYPSTMDFTLRDSPPGGKTVVNPWSGTNSDYDFWFIFAGTSPIQIWVYQLQYPAQEAKTRLDHTYPGSGYLYFEFECNTNFDPSQPTATYIAAWIQVNGQWKGLPFTGFGHPGDPGPDAILGFGDKTSGPGLSGDPLLVSLLHVG